MEHDFNKVINLLYEAKQVGVEIILNDERLQLKVPENQHIDKSLLDQIKNNKQLIIQFLSNENWQAKTSKNGADKILRRDRTAPGGIPLSFGQERMLFIDQFEGSVQYNTPTILRLRGRLNECALSHALRTVVDRHEVLRTVFKEEEGGETYQVIRDGNEWVMGVEDGSGLRDPEGLELRIGELARAPFDLTCDYMLRATLLRLSELEHVVVVTMHHIASDAWSMPVIVREVAELYRAFDKGEAAALQPLELQYADYALWQRGYLQGEVLAKKLGYWKEKLEGVEPLGLPTDYGRPAVKGNRGGSVVFKVEQDLTAELNEVSRSSGSSLFMTLLSVYKILMYRYSGQGDISVGTSIANRSRQEVEGLIGFFVNTLALRTELSDDLSFTDVLSKVKSTTIGAYEHQDVPFEKVVEAVVKDRDPGRSPLFQVMLVLLNTPEAARLQLGELELSREPYVSKVSKFDITFFINETGGMLQGAVEYSTDLYRGETIERMVAHFKELLLSVVRHPGERIGRLKMLSTNEEEQLLGMAAESPGYGRDKTVVGLFEDQVKKTPEATALVFEGERLSYAGLNSEANRLAHKLVAGGVKPGSLVGLVVERGIGMITGMLGILKAGGAYVPVDTAFPEDRIGYMLEDAGARVVVSSKESRGKLPRSFAGEVVETDAEGKESGTLADNKNENIGVSIAPNGLAYVIYTSGSTGKPKGVMVSHANLVDYTLGLEERTGISGCGPFALVSTIATDLGNTVIYASLLLGGELHVFSHEAVSNSSLLNKYFRDKAIGCVKIVPSHWKALSSEQLLLPKHLLVFGGEALGTEVVEMIKGSGAGLRIINHYGPTETTVGKLLHEVDKERRYGKTIPIGKPFSDTQVYVLSKELELSPVGVPGQLFIAGAGVSQGYLNNGELTKEKFIKRPFNKNADANGAGLMYGTGDRVRLLEDGNIEFMGRVDTQVKIRGYRIEPGEVESVLRGSELVSQGVVISRPDRQGNMQLIAYVVGADGWFDREGIVGYLKEQLPEYMVPQVVVEVESIPLTANGKVDRKALPDPDAAEHLSGRYEAPQNEAERKLAEIWEEVLEVEEVGVHDDFFELGGHSLLAVRLISAIRKELGVEMPISDIFDYPTIRGLSGQLENQSSVEVMPKVKAVRPRPERIPLSFSQERLWFIDRLEGSVQYHVPAVLRLKGRVNVGALEEALKQIVERHEVLRTVFKEEDGEAYQEVKPVGGWVLQKTCGAGYAKDAEGLRNYIREQISKPFDLGADDMLRAELITIREGGDTVEEHMLIVTLHHIASDAWSRSIIVKEFVELYESIEGGRAGHLPELEVQYADYALWQRGYLQQEVLEKKLGYWKGKLEGVSPLQLPLDHPRPAVQSNRGAMRGFSISKDQSAGLQKLGQEEGTTLFMTMLAAFKVLLYRYSGQEDICVGTPVAGRHQQEVENLIGFFINTLALRTTVKGDQSFRELLHEVRQSTLEAYQHQEVPFEKVVETVVKERDMSRTPLFQVMFVVNNAPEIPAVKLSNLHLDAESAAHDSTKFDLTFSVTETPSGISAFFNYSTDLFEEETIARMSGNFSHLLESVISQPDEEISSIDMLSTEEERRLLEDFNNTTVNFDSSQTIISLFEQQANKTPGATALVSGERKVTYKELNQRANQLSHYLIAKGLSLGQLVPICTGRNIDMITGMLAILKAGGAYLPVDPEYPQERVDHMMADSAALLAISNSANKKKMQAKGNVKVINVDTDRRNISKENKKNPTPKSTANGVAYVIYTSGSTGLPKGVLIQHASLANLMHWHNDYFQVNASSKATAMAGIGFDAFGWEVWPYLASGASVELVDDATRLSVAALISLFHKQKITHSFISTALVPDLVNASRSTPLSLKYLLTGGDTLPVLDTHDIPFAVVNNYGPTENTVVATSYRVDNSKQLKAPPIGKPIANTRIYILNNKLGLVPIGCPGEICISGTSLASGYLNRHELTSQKFIKNPFETDAESKMYKTGDLGRWLPNGNIEFLGRIDDQVKIRGYRIELGEIETVLINTGLVSNAVIVAHETGNIKRLVAYVIPSVTYSKEAAKKYLSWKLPDYMVPTVWVVVDGFILTPNGKIDKKLLPDPDFQKMFSDQYVAPGNDLEIRIAVIWKDLLKIGTIGIKDDFFELGGHSILALKLVSRMEKEFSKPLALSSIFEYPTIEKYAVMLGGDKQARQSKSLIAIKEGDNKLPFYIVCGAGGTVYTFKKFASFFGPGQTIFGLQQPSEMETENSQEFPGTIEDIAAKYIDEMLAQNPQGPYALAGHCTGGFVAFEIAKQLTALGKEVKYLALFDTIIQEVSRTAAPPALSNLYQIPALAKRLMSKVLLKLNFEVYLLRHHPKQAIQYKLFKFRKRIKNSEVDAGISESFDSVSKLYLQARMNYKLDPYVGDITVFYAKEHYYFMDKMKMISYKKFEYNYETKNIWKKFARSARFFEVDGEHSTIFNSKHTAKFAELVQASIDDTLNNTK